MPRCQLKFNARKLNRESGMKDIALRLRAEAMCHPEEDNVDLPRAEFHIAKLVIRCRPTRPAILAVAAKYEKGLQSSWPRAESRYTGLNRVGKGVWYD